ncbi:DUF4158 domain-containing protein [Nonomuraea sp. NPDC050786]|uniref:DUF4158 domain-containing protein n=1 Tax=Nonomuraea sp. NPDC050786 TaxID=3154840 RepID=UPI0033C108CA
MDRTAYPRFARALSMRELAEVFTPSSAEVEWARGKTQDDQHLLALLVWLKAYQRLGYFPKLADVPAVVAKHVRGVVGLPEGTELAEAARPTSPTSSAGSATGSSTWPRRPLPRPRSSISNPVSCSPHDRRAGLPPCVVSQGHHGRRVRWRRRGGPQAHRSPSDGSCSLRA